MSDAGIKNNILTPKEWVIYVREDLELYYFYARVGEIVFSTSYSKSLKSFTPDMGVKMCNNRLWLIKMLGLEKVSEILGETQGPDTGKNHLLPDNPSKILFPVVSYLKGYDFSENK